MKTIYSTAVNRELAAMQQKQLRKAINARRDRKSTLIGLMLLFAAVGLVLALNSLGLIHNF